MRDVKIKDVPLVDSLSGQEKIPVSDGSGSPKAITVLLILDLTPAPDLSEYALKSDIPTDYLTEAPSGGLYARQDGKWVPILADLLNTVTFNDNDGSPELITTGDTSWIKGRRCLVKTTDSGVAICYLNENNSNLFHDGVTEAKLDGTMGQFMTDIPEYWFSMDESVEGVHTLSLANQEVDGWKKSRRVLLGVTEAVNVDGVLWSRVTGDEQSTGSLTSTVFHNYAVANGEGFDIIDYESHCKIAHLFYAKYANRDPQTMTLFGYGQDSYTRTIGTTSTLGNNDGKTSTQISFLGIEDFYGGKYEWMSGIHSNGSTYYMYDGYEPDKVPTAEYRTVDIGGSARSGYITKVYHGEHADMIPTKVTGSSTTHYCDYGYVARSGLRVVMRSSDSAYSHGGVAFFDADYGSGNSYAYIGSRLQYRGEILVIDNIEDFINL